MFPSYLSRLNKSSSSIAFSIFFQGCFSTLRTVLLWSALSSFLKLWWPKVGVRLPLSFEHFVCRNRSFTGNKPNLHTDTWVGLCHLASVLGPVSGQVLEIIGFCCSPHLISERQTPTDGIIKKMLLLISVANLCYLFACFHFHRFWDNSYSLNFCTNLTYFKDLAVLSGKKYDKSHVLRKK